MCSCCTDSGVDSNVEGLARTDVDRQMMSIVVGYLGLLDFDLIDQN